MRTAFLLLFIVSFYAQGQPLRDINYNYLYDGSLPFSLQLKTIRVKNNVTGLFAFQVKDTTDNVSNYIISWETRSTLQEKAGVEIPSDSVIYEQQSNHAVNGQLLLRQIQQTFLVAKVIQKSIKRAWYFYSESDSKSPQYVYIEADDEPVIKRYTKTGSQVSVKTDSSIVVSFYSDDFPAGTPVFSETVARVSKGMQADTVYVVRPGEKFSPAQKGLYLIQPDTASERGVAFRAENDYPRFSKVENLADPLIYICTRLEFEKVKKAKGDKQAFDRVILGITGDKERAKLFMKTYFRRVEMANEFFTSYKEGWKTDRGMIFIIFGPPEEVLKFSDREVWSYSSEVKLSFDFSKSATIFDPTNYVLIRNKKYKETWYEAIDLRRNARF
jgi:GWxTD domain-containing protein